METRSRKKVKVDETGKGKEKQDLSYESDSEWVENELSDSDAEGQCEAEEEDLDSTNASNKSTSAVHSGSTGGQAKPIASTAIAGAASMLTNNTSNPTQATAKPTANSAISGISKTTTTTATMSSKPSGKTGPLRADSSSGASTSKGRSLTYYIQRELSDLANMDDADLLVAPESEDQLTVIKSVILGSCDTPYAFGFFHFRGTYPPNYPNVAPTVVITTTEHGRVRFNPNLYADGKVCLSILGTWRGEAGEQWSSAQSTYTILRSIQSLLHSMPYLNEPGFEELNQRGSKEEAEQYNLKLAHETVRVAVCWVMDSILDNNDHPDRSISHPFSYILKHWFLYYYNIHVQRCEEALKDPRCADGQAFATMPFEGSNNQASGRFMYTQLIQRLNKIKKALDDEEEEWIAQGKVLTANRASCAQHLDYERLKFQDACPDGISASPEDDNMFVWTASIFDRLGPYDGGCFQVRLVFSKNYTEGEPPRVRFLSPLFHPQITANDFRPRLGFRLPASRKGTNIISVLEECQAILRNSPTPDPMLHVNPVAATMARDDPAAFAKKVRNDVARSLEAM